MEQTISQLIAHYYARCCFVKFAHTCWGKNMQETCTTNGAVLDMKIYHKKQIIKMIHTCMKNINIKVQFLSSMPNRSSWEIRYLYN